MPNSNRFKMSQERLDALKDELYYLETVREKEVSELIKEARSFGDLSENSEYDEAKTEQGKLGRGLHGHKAGETVVVNAPAGDIKFEILSVENN